MAEGLEKIARQIALFLDPRTYLFLIRLARFYVRINHSETRKVRMGKGASIVPTAMLQYGEHVTIGDNTHINHHCCLWASREAGIKIGNDVLFGPGVYIISANHTFKKDRLIREQPGQHADVEIGNDVWLGSQTIVLPGVKIGEGSLVGAGSVVTKSIPPYSVAVGNPAEVIKQRN